MSSNFTFWLKLKQFWPFEEIFFFSNGGHLGWRAGLSDTILRGTHPARFGLIWFSGFVRPSTFHILIFSSETTGPIATKLWWNGPWMAPFENCVRWPRLPSKMADMPNLHNRYKSAERKISQKYPEYMLNYSLPCSCS
jgi:hypothetical protein